MSGAAPDRVVEAARLYDSIAPQWAGDAELVYAPLAQALVDRGAGSLGGPSLGGPSLGGPPLGGPPLAGSLVVDVGAGTGAGSRALAAHGARVVAVDLAHGMLAHQRHARPPACVGDIRSLPLAARSVDGVVAPFVLNHLDDPVAGLLEAARVVRPGGVVLASTFDEDDRPPVKDVIDAAIARHGWVAPPAYAWLKDEALPQTGTVAALRDVARAAGLVEVTVERVAVDTGLTAPADLVRYRLGQAHTVAFVASLSPDARDALVADAVDAVTRVHDGASLAPSVLFLVARSAG